MARDPYTPDCSIKGCTRATVRGKLCRKHQAMVPQVMVIAGVTEGMAAQHRIARKHHEKHYRYVRDLLTQTATGR